MASTTATQKETIYLGNLTAKIVKDRKIIAGAICLDQLSRPDVQELIYEYEGKRYLNVKVIQRKQASKSGRTHFVEIDTFVPNKKGLFFQTKGK